MSDQEGHADEIVVQSCITIRVYARILKLNAIVSGSFKFIIIQVVVRKKTSGFQFI